jgi:hypothetical protein
MGIRSSCLSRRSRPTGRPAQFRVTRIGISGAGLDIIPVKVLPNDEAFGMIYLRKANSDLVNHCKCADGYHPSKPGDAEIREWVEDMSSFLEGIEPGQRYVYLDGLVVPVDVDTQLCRAMSKV